MMFVEMLVRVVIKFDEMTVKGVSLLLSVLRLR